MFTISETSDNQSTASSKVNEVNPWIGETTLADVADEEEPPAASEENSASPDIQGLAIDDSSNFTYETLSDTAESSIQTV